MTKRLENNTKKNYLEKYQLFLEDRDFLDEKTFNTINKIISGIVDIFDESKINKKEIGEIKQNPDLLKTTVDKNELLIDIFVLCMDAYDKGNRKRIKSLIEEYKYNPLVDLKEYFELEEQVDELDLLDRIETIIEKVNYDSDSMIEDYYKAYGRPTKEVIDYLVTSGIDIDDYKDYYYYQEIEKKYKEIIRIKEEGIPGIDFAEKLYELELMVNSYEDLKEEREYEKNKKEQIEEDSISSYFGNEANYLVFFDKEKYLETEEELLRTHPDVISKRTFQGKCNKLINNTVETIKNDNLSRNIQLARGRPNPYDVRELRRGSIRLGFKILDYDEMDGHKIIVLFLPSYGQTDGKLKQKGLQSSVDLYEKNIDKAKHIEHIFSSKASPEEREEAIGMVEEFQDYYQSLSASINKENRL